MPGFIIPSIKVAYLGYHF